MAATNVPNVWTQMGYVPPRGQCNFKQSIMSAKCPCLRFMLHPLKSASSYECDGCSHHASFHSLDNTTEDEIRKRWVQEAREKERLDTEDQVSSRPRKRLKEIGFSESHSGSTRSLAGRSIENGALGLDGLEERVDSLSGLGSSKTKAKKREQPSTRGTRSRGKVVGVVEEDGDFIELD